MKKLIYISLLAALFLAACGPQATPTMSPADVQSTALSAANTTIAQTQAAIPTNTPLPPTETPTNTPPPTNTVAPALSLTLPTSSVPTQAPTQSSGNTNSCIRALNMGEAGPTHPILVQNESGGTLNLSLNLYQPNDFGQCGALSWANVGKGAQFMIQLPSGYWFAYAWISLKGGGSSESSGNFYVQPAMFEKQRLIIMEDIIVMKP